MSTPPTKLPAPQIVADCHSLARLQGCRITGLIAMDRASAVAISPLLTELGAQLHSLQLSPSYYESEDPLVSCTALEELVLNALSSPVLSFLPQWMHSLSKTLKILSLIARRLSYTHPPAMHTLTSSPSISPLLLGISYRYYVLCLTCNI